MISFIVRQSIRYPGVVVALALTVIVYGLYVLSLANLDVFPEFSPSQVVIQTEAPGLSAELVERQVSQPIESVLAGASIELQRRFASEQRIGAVNRFLWEHSAARGFRLYTRRLARSGGSLDFLTLAHREHWVHRFLFPVAYAHMRRRFPNALLP